MRKGAAAGQRARGLAIVSAACALTFIASAGATPTPDGPTLAEAVNRFVNVKAEPTETRMEGFSDFLAILPRAQSACEQAAAGKAGLLAAVSLQAAAQVADVHYVEHGELILYGLAKTLRGTDRRAYIGDLDDLGGTLDKQLREARDDRRLAAAINVSCGATVKGPGAAKEWSTLTKLAEKALGRLQLAYGI